MFNIAYIDNQNLYRASRGIDWHVTQANVEKTELLYPEINRIIGDRDISVCYTSDISKQTHFVTSK